MTTGIGSILLHLWLVVGLSMMGVALLLVIIQKRLLETITCFSISARQRFLWCVVLLPYGFGIYGAILVLTPVLSHKIGIALDHLHLYQHRGHFHWLSWQGLGVLMLACFTGLKLQGMLFHRVQQHRYLKTLLAFSDMDARGCYRMESDIPNAYTFGVINPKILLSSALVKALSARELNIVYSHELAHQHSRDPLRLWLFGMLLSVFIPTSRRSLYTSMELFIEQQADAVVAREFNDPRLIASTLVKVNRLALRYSSQNQEDHACAFCLTAIEQRVRQLLHSGQERTFPVLPFVLVAVMLGLIGFYCANVVLHSRIETLLHYHP